MYFKQADIFWGMDRDFVKKIMDIGEKESCRGGDFLFQTGDPARYFYILLKGAVKLRREEIGQTVYTASHAGEAFGWSSLIGRENYSASAMCTGPASLLKFDRDVLLKRIEDDPPSGMLFFRGLAGVLGNRLLNSYTMMSAYSHSRMPPSQGISTSDAAAETYDG